MSKSACTIPTYMADFHCIGPECELSCCQYHWEVTVDQKAYDRIAALPAGDLKDAAEDAIVPRKAPGPDAEPYQLKMAQGACRLLDGEGLCRLHKEAGEDLLPRTCAVFPRLFAQLHRRTELHGRLSCPEVGRKVLRDPEALSVAREEPAEGLVGHHDLRPVAVKISGQQAAAKVDVLKQVDAFLTRMLTNRDRPFWERLFVVGLVFELFDKKTIDQPDSRVTDLISTIEAGFQGGALDDMLAAANRDETAQFVTLLELLGRRLGPQARSPLAPLIQRLVKALNVDYRNPVQAVPAYQAAYRDYFRPVMAENPHVLENYILVHFRAKVVQGRLAAGWRTYLRIMVQYAAFRGLGIGIAAERKDAFSVDDLVEVAALVSRTMDQAGSFLDQILDRFAELDRLSMAFLGVLFADPPDDAVA